MTLVLCGLVAPAAIIFVICLVLVPGPTVPKSTPKALVWRRKLWEVSLFSYFAWHALIVKLLPRFVLGPLIFATWLLLHS